jgi:hypothetical protein
MLKRIGCACAVGMVLAGSSMAQKYPGNTIPTEPAVPYTAPLLRPPTMVPQAQPMRPTPPLASPTEPAGDASAERVARSLPLDPGLRELRDRLPPDIPAVERALRLRPPRGPATDMRGRTPTPREIVDALARR